MQAHDKTARLSLVSGWSVMICETSSAVQWIADSSHTVFDVCGLEQLKVSIGCCSYVWKVHHTDDLFFEEGLEVDLGENICAVWCEILVRTKTHWYHSTIIN